jgi:hypothetical protein
MISGLDPQMHWQILVVLSFEMFLPRVLNEKHMSLPLALTPITTSLYSETFQKLSTDHGTPAQRML